MHCQKPLYLQAIKAFLTMAAAKAGQHLTQGPEHADDRTRGTGHRILGRRSRSRRYGPREAGAALVASRVLGRDREGVATQAKPRVARRARARTGAQGTAIELADKAHAHLGV